VTTDAPGSVALNGGSVKTTGAQTYNENVTLGGDDTLTSTGNGAIDFAGTLDGAHNLTVNTGGATTFGGVVGGGTALTSVTTDAPGTVAINGGAVTTTGAQTFNELVAIGGDTTLSSTGNGTITLGGGATGAGSKLTVNAANGDADWNGPITANEVEIIGQNLIMKGDVTTNGPVGAVMSANVSFQNPNSHAITTTGGGKSLVYSVSPGADIFGGLTGPFQFSTFYPAPPLFVGSGFLFRVGTPPASNLPPIASAAKTHQQSYEANAVFTSFDVPRPDPQTHDGGIFSIIEAPDGNYIFRARHPHQHGDIYDKRLDVQDESDKDHVD